MYQQYIHKILSKSDAQDNIQNHIIETVKNELTETKISNNTIKPIIFTIGNVTSWTTSSIMPSKITESNKNEELHTTNKKQNKIIGYNTFKQIKN